MGKREGWSPGLLLARRLSISATFFLIGEKKTAAETVASDDAPTYELMLRNLFLVPGLLLTVLEPFLALKPNQKPETS